MLTDDDESVGTSTNDMEVDGETKQGGADRSRIFASAPVHPNLGWYTGSINEWSQQPFMQWWHYDGGRKPFPVDPSMTENQVILWQYPWKPFQDSLARAFDFRSKASFVKEDYYPVGMLYQMRAAIRSCLAFYDREHCLPFDGLRKNYYSPSYVKYQINHLQMLLDCLGLFERKKSQIGPFNLCLVEDKLYRTKSFVSDFESIMK